MIHELLNNRPNPLLTLPPHLDPTKPWQHGPAVISSEQFHQTIQLATKAALEYAQMNASIRGVPGGYLSLQEMKEYLKIEMPERSLVLDSVRAQ